MAWMEKASALCVLARSEKPVGSISGYRPVDRGVLLPSATLQAGADAPGVTGMTGTSS